MEKINTMMNGSGTISILMSSTDAPFQQQAYSQSSLAVLLDKINGTLWLVVPPVLMVLGCFGNVMTIVVMRGMRASESTACLSVYFTALAVSDLCVISIPMVFYWPEVAFGIHMRQFHDATCFLPVSIAFATSTTSAWFLVVMTCQRMMSVILPHRVGLLCTVRRAKIITAALVAVACVSYTYILFNYRIKTVDENTRLCQNIDTVNSDTFYLLVFVFSTVIPFCFLLIANTVLVRGVILSVKMTGLMSGMENKQTTARSVKVSSMTVTLIVTSAVFLVLAMPIDLFDMYLQEIDFYGEGIHDGDLRAKLMLVETVGLLLVTSNSAVNFYLYILTGRKFREETKRCLCLPFKN